MPGGGMTARLPRAVGIRKARELSFTGNYLGAAEAERMGLVNRVVAADRLMSTAREMAGQILSSDPVIIRNLKRLYDLTSEASLGEALRIEQDFFRAYRQRGHLRNFDERRRVVMERGRAQTRP
jgi:enoyl-CoA hydratase